MSEEQRYDEEQWSDLPLPDVNKSWQKMEALLDEDERRRRVLPWWFLRTAALCLLLIGLAVGGWLWLHSTARGKEQESASLIKKGGRQRANELQTNIERKEAQQTGNSQKQGASAGINKKKVVAENTPVQPTTSPDETSVANLKTPSAGKPAAVQAGDKRQATTAVVTAVRKQRTSDQTGKKKTTQTAVASLAFLNKEDVKKSSGAAAVRKKDIIPDLHPAVEKKDLPQKNIAAKKDSTTRTDSMKTLAPPVVKTEETKKPSKGRPPFVFSAGVGFQQAIALHNGPSPIPDSGGRKRPFFDYYPSVYVKLQRGRWAAQVEFQYSVPQPVASLSFSQKTTVDAASMTSSTERQTVQKLYYHQLPVSINYHLLPQWSVGAGGVYNILAGAATQKEVVSKYLPTGTETVSKSSVPVKGYKDSFLYKTTAGLLVQTDYHWKRFSLGLRYTQNLQPFIKYTKPNGDVLDEKNNAMQAVLRFRLWKSE